MPVCKGWFPYDGYDRCDRWEKPPAIVAIMHVWKPLFSDRSDHSDHYDNDSLRYFSVLSFTRRFFPAIVAIMWKPALRGSLSY